MEAIKIFENDRFGEVRVAGTSENPLFCLADVCKILGLRVDAVQSRLTDAPIRIGVTDSIIRKHGAYMTNDTLEKALASPDFLIQLATNLKEEQQKRIEAERKVTEAAPAVAFTKAVQSANSSCLIGELAKLIAQNGYSIGEKRLFAWMRDNGYLGKQGERYNIPNQQYVEQGLFELKKGVRSGSNGVLHTTITPKVTGKGQVYFVNKFLGNKEAC